MTRRQNLTPKQRDIVNRAFDLKRINTRIRGTNQRYLESMVFRGKCLTKLARLIRESCEQMTPEMYAKLVTIIEEYEEKATVDSVNTGKRKRKYNRRDQ